MRDLQWLAMNAEETKKIWSHLVVRGFLEGIHNSQVRLHLRKKHVDAELSIETILEKAVLKPSQKLRQKKENTKSQFINPTKQ